MKWILAIGAGLLLAHAAAPCHAQARPKPMQTAPGTVAHGLFNDVRLFKPAGTVQQFVFMLSANEAPDAAEQQAIDRMVDGGALVAAVPLAPFYKRLEKQDGKCTYAAGAFENLSRHLQAYEQVPGYRLPMLVGTGAAAPFAYGVLAQAPAGSFSSALSVGFCPSLALKTPLCATNGLRWAAAGVSNAAGFDLLPATTLATPWAAVPGAACSADSVQAFVQQVPKARWVADGPNAFATAYAQLTAVQQTTSPAEPPAPGQLADLPMVEVPVAGAGKRFAVLLSGDGGWAGIDKELAAALAAQGIPVAGFDSLRYFWKARTPDGLAADLDRLIRYYAARWQRSEVILIGYSQGADVLPFAVNRLPAATRATVRLTALLGLAQQASFEFHFSNWLGPSGDKPILPEARRLSAADTLCVQGDRERNSLCPKLAPAHARVLLMKGDHHFGGEYQKLARLIVEAAR
ncbi:virulence factor family protein [Rhizobacter sp. OV335]|uniref:virulence factor family protein n=1 Tax=Rhizobacter sp. OV335 TaxID=1500264 RepID=UPI0009175614|nr:AcvB/VirJ family lysyl-phosphatidylglycerol hydrolase [Rhizobacter sp. OV335]SHM73463.1 Type IV secretory pathway, VirJ component [Rhizobacter sp. OV335]